MNWFSQVQQRLRAGAATLARPAQASTPPRQESTTPWAPGQPGPPSWQSRLGPNPAAPPWTPPTPPAMRATPEVQYEQPMRQLTDREAAQRAYTESQETGEEPLEAFARLKRTGVPEKNPRRIASWAGQQARPAEAMADILNDGPAKRKALSEEERAKSLADLNARSDAAWQQARLANTYEMTPEEFAALDDNRRAAVLFNTELVEAVRADSETGGSNATSDLLGRLGIETRDEAELNEFLRLDRAISESILDKLSPEVWDAEYQRNPDRVPFQPGKGAPNEVQLAAEQFGLTPSPPDPSLLNAASASKAMARSLAADLETRGSTDGTEQLTGYGNSVNDGIVREAYAYMIDSRNDLTPDDVARGIAELNAASGGTVTPQQVWDFLTSQLDRVSYSQTGSRIGQQLWAPEADQITGEEFTPLDIAEIRRRYGLGG